MINSIRLKYAKKFIAEKAGCDLTDIVDKPDWDRFGDIYTVEGDDRIFYVVSSEDMEKYLEFVLIKLDLLYEPRFLKEFCNTSEQTEDVWAERCSETLYDIAYDYLDEEFKKVCIREGVATESDFEEGGIWADPASWDNEIHIPSDFEPSANVYNQLVEQSLYDRWVSAKLSKIYDFMGVYMKMNNLDFERLLNNTDFDANADLDKTPIIEDCIFQDRVSRWLEWAGFDPDYCFYSDKFNCYLIITDEQAEANGLI